MQILKVNQFNNYNYVSKKEVKNKKNVTNKYYHTVELPRLVQPTFKNLAPPRANLTEIKKLTDVVSNQIYGKKGIIEKYSQYQEARGITGNFPQVWLNRLANKEDFDVSAFAESFGNIFTKDRHFSNMDNVKKSLNLLFDQHGFINKNDTIELSYLGKGFFGRAYKFSINNEDPVVIKEFKRTYRYHNNHGNYSEQNIAEYINRYSGNNTNMAQYHYGDTYHGVMIVDFISKDTPLPENIVELDELGLAYDDAKPRNLVNDYIIDYGGIIKISNLAGNKTAQDVYSAIKHESDDNKKITMFYDIFNDTSSQDYHDKLIGLTHSIKFLPSENHKTLYRKIFEFNDNDLNIALIENFKNMSFPFDEKKVYMEKFAQTNDLEMKRVLSREIRHLPSEYTHSLMEKYALSEKDNTVKKYLARNLNFYYKNRERRIEIYDNLMKNADMYANIALINSLENIPKKYREERFNQFYQLDNFIIDCALARNIEIFSEDEDTMQKWLDILINTNDFRVQRALCESVRFIPDNLKVANFVRLLEVQDQNAKENLAEALIYIPNYEKNHKEWIEKLYEASGNSVKRELAITLSNIKSENIRKYWAEKLYDAGDSSVKEILTKAGFVFDK